MRSVWTVDWHDLLPSCVFICMDKLISSVRVLFLGICFASAQVIASVQLDHASTTVDGGSAILQGGGYVLAGTVGQWDAAGSDAHDVLAGGYWVQVRFNDLLFADSFESE